VIIQMSCMEMRAPTISIRWYPKLCLGVASQPAIHRANRLMAKPAHRQAGGRQGGWSEVWGKYHGAQGAGRVGSVQVSWEEQGSPASSGLPTLKDYMY